jgi:hypothetical protein
MRPSLAGKGQPRTNSYSSNCLARMPGGLYMLSDMKLGSRSGT